MTTGAPGSRAWVAFGIVLSVAFAILAHAALVDRVPRAVGAVLSLVPLALVALWALRRSRHRNAVALALIACGIALALGWNAVERHFPDIFFLEHAGTNLVLGILFGRTLAAGREPLCARFARMVHGELPPEVQRYSRAVTVAWTAFFAAIFLASCALYLGGHMRAWSMLANFITAIGVGAMFVLEYAIRGRVLPHWERVGIISGVRAFSRHFREAN